MTPKPWTTFLAQFVPCLFLLGTLVQGCGNHHGPEGQVGAYGVVYPTSAVNQAQLVVWLDETLVKAVELTGQHLGPGAYFPKAGKIVWHESLQDLVNARAALGHHPDYDGWAGWILGDELHVAAGRKGVSQPYGALGHLLKHWHIGDHSHQDPEWAQWDRDYAAWDAALFWSR